MYQDFEIENGTLNAQGSVKPLIGWTQTKTSRKQFRIVKGN